MKLVNNLKKCGLVAGAICAFVYIMIQFQLSDLRYEKPNAMQNNGLPKHLERYYFGCINHTTKLQGITISEGIGMSHSECILKCHYKQYNVAAIVKITNQCLCDFTINENDQFKYKSYCTDGLKVFSTSVIEPPTCDVKTLLNGNAKMVALGSFPGSGNTWVRFLIESSSGVYTGSVYVDGRLYKSGFLGEKLPYNARKVSAVKDHYLDFDYEYYSAILLIRNPFDAIVSRFNFDQTSSHVKRAPEEKLKSQEFKKYAAVQAPLWTHVIRRALEENDKVLVIYYEHLKHDVASNMRKILNFLPPENLNMNPKISELMKQIRIEQMLSCLLMNHKEGNFKRKSQETGNLDYYDAAANDAVLDEIIKVNTLLHSHNQPVLPEDYYTKP